MVRCPLKAGHHWCRPFASARGIFPPQAADLPSFVLSRPVRSSPGGHSADLSLLSGPERARAGWRCDLQPILSGHLSLAANPAYQQSSLYQGQPH